MMMPHQHPDVEAYRKAAIEHFEVGRDIHNRRNSRHEIERAIMPRLIAKRDRLALALAPLKAKADAYEAAYVRHLIASREQAARPQVAPAARSPLLGDGDLDIPAFLRRRA
jgi:hypothetical protein